MRSRALRIADVDAGQGYESSIPDFYQAGTNQLIFCGDGIVRGLLPECQSRGDVRSTLD